MADHSTCLGRWWLPRDMDSSQDSYHYYTDVFPSSKFPLLSYESPTTLWLALAVASKLVKAIELKKCDSD